MTADAQTPAPAPAPAPPPSLLKIDVQKFLGESTKYTVFAVCVLYAIGFIIWHSYLATYGVSAMGFFQVEYLAAAFCYLFILGGFALPPAVLIGHFLSSKEEREKGQPLSFLLYLWYLISIKLAGLFFPDPHPSPWRDPLMTIGLVLLGLYFCVMLVCRKKWGQTRAYQSLWDIDLVAIYLMLCVIVSLSLNHEVNKLFLFYALFFYVVLINATGKDIRRLWAEANVTVRFVLLCLVFMLLIGNLHLFGTSQFGHIPQRLGGGKPETAYLKFAASHPDVATSLNLPAVTNAPAFSGWVGPVPILFRTENALIFVNQSNPTNAAAKEVRADVLEAVIFIKK